MGALLPQPITGSWELGNWHWYIATMFICGDHARHSKLEWNPHINSVSLFFQLSAKCANTYQNDTTSQCTTQLNTTQYILTQHECTSNILTHHSGMVIWSLYYFWWFFLVFLIILTSLHCPHLIGIGLLCHGQCPNQWGKGIMEILQGISSIWAWWSEQEPIPIEKSYNT